MSDDEPTTEEFFEAVGDIIVSNRVVDIVRQKFRAQSYYQFFNRLWATGLILFIIGIIGITMIYLIQGYELSILDVTNSIFIVAIALFIWFGLTIIGAVNEGEDPLVGEIGPEANSEAVKFSAGLGLTAVLVIQIFIGSQGPVEIIVLYLFATMMTSMWLIALAWMFGGLSGLIRLRRESE